MFAFLVGRNAIVGKVLYEVTASGADGTQFRAAPHSWRFTIRCRRACQRQWANGKDSILGPPMIGEFKNGRGEFFDPESWKGRAVLVRFIWSSTTTNTPHFEQCYSDDGGMIWGNELVCQSKAGGRRIR